MGLLRMAARTAVVAGTASAVAGGVQHHQQQKELIQILKYQKSFRQHRRQLLHRHHQSHH